MKTTAIIPVKRHESAFTRLAGVLGAPARAGLSQAMMLDAIGELRRCKTIDELLVVTADPGAADAARQLGAGVLEQDGDTGHSEAAAAGVESAHASGAERAALLPIDCPLIDAEELDRHLGRTARTLIVPDRHGTGTNALVLSPPECFGPAFGPGSFERHLRLARAADGEFALELIAGLELDVDTPEDLAELWHRLMLEPGRAPRTSEVVRHLDPAGLRHPIGQGAGHAAGVADHQPARGGP